MQASFSELEYAAKKKQTRRDRFLAEIDAVTPWGELERTVTPFYPRSGGRGRPPIGLTRMLRMYVAQQCFGLSDEGIEDALYDSQAIRRFVGIDLNRELAPDAPPLLNFRHLLKSHQLTESIFNTINGHVAAKGLLLREGTIVDAPRRKCPWGATLIAAPPSTKNKEGKRDPEMHQSKKGKQWYFGMKATIGVDAQSGLVHTVIGTAGNVSDETDAFGDAGYQGVEKREESLECPETWHVAMRPSKRKPLPATPLGGLLERYEHTKASVRAKVEHPFHVLKNLFRHRKTRYKGLAKNTAQLFSLFGLGNFFMAALFLALWGCNGTNGFEPTAREGVFDLSHDANLLSTSTINLNGEWAFYWQQLLTPADFTEASPHPPSAYITLPGAWNDVQVDGANVGRAGYATLRLRVLTGRSNKSAGELALKLGTIESAYRLWVNGTLLSENGVIGLAANLETPTQSSDLIRLPATRELDLILQVSNYHYREGGVVSPIAMGSSKRLESVRFRERAVVSFCIGAIAVIGLYHLALYAFRRRNLATLYFGGYCLLWTGYLLTSDSTDWAITHLSLRIPDPLLNRVDLLCFVLSVPFCHAFLRSLYPDDLSRRVGLTTWTMAAVFTALGIALPTLAFTSVIPVYYLFAFFMIVYFLICLAKAVLRHQEGANFILTGFVILGCIGINDMLLDLQAIRSVFLMYFGLLVFVLCQAFALSLRFSRAFSAVEQLSSELAEMNTSLKQERDESNRLAHEIVNVSEEERRRISRELHDGLCQQLTGTRLHFSVLRRKASDFVENDPGWEQLAFMLESLTNQAYDLAHGLWPVDHEGHGAYLSLGELVDRLSATTGTIIDLRENRHCETCQSARATQLFRIAQEAVTNAVRHACAVHIIISFNCADGVTMQLVVRDDGIGRNRAVRSNGGLGIRIMEHRARIIGGLLKIEDIPEGGTQVSCTARCEVMDNQALRS